MGRGDGKAERVKPTKQNTKQQVFVCRAYLGIGEVFVVQMQASHIEPDAGAGRDVVLAQHHIFCGFTRLHRQTAATRQTCRSLQWPDGCLHSGNYHSYCNAEHDNANKHALCFKV